MKWTLCPVGSLLLAIAPVMAQGADVPVSYLVNLNALRASAPAGPRSRSRSTSTTPARQRSRARW